MNVALDHVCCPKNLTTNWIAENVHVQPLAEAGSFRKFENTLVVHNSCADVTSMQGNDPDPPAATKQMIGGPFTTGATTIGIVGETFSPFVAVPLLYAGESRPDCIDGMVVVRSKMPELTREHRCAPSGIDNPTASSAKVATIDNGIHSLPLPVVELAVYDLGRPPEMAARLHCEFEHVRIVFCQLMMTEIMGEAQNPRHVTTAHFGS